MFTPVESPQAPSLTCVNLTFNHHVDAPQEIAVLFATRVLHLTPVTHFVETTGSHSPRRSSHRASSDCPCTSPRPRATWLYPPTSAQKRGHGVLLSAPGQVTPFVHRTTYFPARIPVFGGGARTHAAFYNASGPRSASAPLVHTCTWKGGKRRIGSRLDHAQRIMKLMVPKH